MSKLLCVNFRRLFHMKSFYLAITLMMFYPIMSCTSDYAEILEYGYAHYIEESIWSFGTMLSFAMPVLVYLFIGPDYTDKTIRNKLIIGYSKKDVFLANMFTMMGACFTLFLVWKITFCAIGLPLLYVGNPLYIDILISLEELAACMLLTSILVLLVMFVSGKVSAGILAMVLSLCLIASGVIIKTRLAEEEFIDSEPTWIEFDGTVHVNGTNATVPNPKFIPEGPTKEAIRYIERINVGAQLLDVTDNHEIAPVWYLFFDNVMIGLIVAGGIVLYKRKDIL